MITLVSVSVELLVFSAPVLWTPGVESNIYDGITGAQPNFAAAGGPAASVSVSNWVAGATPAVGDPWVLAVPLTFITPAAPATGFANSAGLVVA